MTCLVVFSILVSPEPEPLWHTVYIVSIFPQMYLVLLETPNLIFYLGLR